MSDVYDIEEIPEEWERPEATWTNLLLVLSVPDMEVDGELIDADEIADAFVQMINEQRAEAAETSPFATRKVRINAIPSPQWMDGPTLKILVDAVHILHYALKHAAAAPPEPKEPRP